MDRTGNRGQARVQGSVQGTRQETVLERGRDKIEKDAGERGQEKGSEDTTGQYMTREDKGQDRKHDWG